MWNPLDCCEGTAEAPTVAETSQTDRNDISSFDISPTEEFLVSAYRLIAQLQDKPRLSDLDQAVLRSAGGLFRQLADRCDRAPEIGAASKEINAPPPFPVDVASHRNLTAGLETLSDDEEVAAAQHASVFQTEATLSEIGLPQQVVDILVAQGISQPYQLQKMSDEQLLNIEGVGPGRLRMIREALTARS